MDADAMMERMITQRVQARPLGEWPEVLSNYAACLKNIESKVNNEDMNSLLSVGADFYRTLAQAEAYRANAGKPS